MVLIVFDSCFFHDPNSESLSVSLLCSAKCLLYSNVFCECVSLIASQADIPYAEVGGLT